MTDVSLTPEEIGVLVQLMNNVSGMENAKVLLPIYEKLRKAVLPFPVDEEK